MVGAGGQGDRARRIFSTLRFISTSGPRERNVLAIPRQTPTAQQLWFTSSPIRHNLHQAPITLKTVFTPVYHSQLTPHTYQQSTATQETDAGAQNPPLAYSPARRRRSATGGTHRSRCCRSMTGTARLRAHAGTQRLATGAGRRWPLVARAHERGSEAAVRTRALR